MEAKNRPRQGKYQIKSRVLARRAATAHVDIGDLDQSGGLDWERASANTTAVRKYKYGRYGASEKGTRQESVLPIAESTAREETGGEDKGP
ncbi:hypothetical protein NMY22_g11263 [Coprinellus aureogranulatus]|nr:hypothetical protein NMY22_g11263 [Coprinellus aureogranulatus]